MQAINNIKPDPNKPFYALKWTMCDFEKQGYHLNIKTI